MAFLYDNFMKTINTLGLPNLTHPIFYSFPIGIRFEIGGKQEIYLENGDANPEYISAAFARAKNIYDSIFTPNILRIDVFTENKDFLNELGMPSPLEVIHDYITEDDDIYYVEHLYWDLSLQHIDINHLLLEIIKADIGGFNELASTVFLLDTENIAMYHLYDDRGLDVVAKDKEYLMPLYQKFNEWIFDYDRKSIDNTFNPEK